MSAHAESAAAPAPAIREAGERDLAVMAALAASVFRTHYPAMISGEQIEWMLERMYSETAFRRQRGEGHVFLIAHLGTVPIAFASFSVSAEELSEGSIHKLYILPEHQGRGVGRLLIERICARMAALDRARVSLTVNRRNILAINFYFKMGFAIRSVVDIEIGGGFQMNDFIMVKRLTESGQSASLPAIR